MKDKILRTLPVNLSDETVIDQIVGHNLTRMRRAKNLSQEDIGKPVGITYQQVQKYEQGANRISASRIAQFAAILECRPEDFFEGVDTGTVTPFARKFADVMRYGEMIEAMPVKIRKPLTKYIKDLSAAVAQEHTHG